jgi:polysaccharide export outer membrane protein
MRYKIFLTGLLLFLLVSTSCNTYKKYTYLRDMPITGNNQEIEKNKPTYRIQPGDILYVRVITPDQSMGEIFNPFGSSQQSFRDVGYESMYYFGYTVSENGDIEIPVIDSVHVGGLTLDEAKRKIEEQARKYLKKPQIIVKMAQFKFTLLGEVQMPGIKNVYDNELNLIEAVSYGGGINYSGDRRKVLILRSTKTGTKTFQVDLTDNTIVESDLYHVMPNDIIYVKPRQTTAFRQETSNFLFALSALSSTVTAALLILRLGL